MLFNELLSAGQSLANSLTAAKAPVDDLIGHVPSIPQLKIIHMGKHILSSDLKDGSFMHKYVCDENGHSAVSELHPNLRFDKPMGEHSVVVFVFFSKT